MFKRMLEKLQRGIGYWCCGTTVGGSYLGPNSYIPGCWDIHVQDWGRDGEYIFSMRDDPRWSGKFIYSEPVYSFFSYKYGDMKYPWTPEDFEF